MIVIHEKKIVRVASERSASVDVSIDETTAMATRKLISYPRPSGSVVAFWSLRVYKEVPR